MSTNSSSNNNGFVVRSKVKLGDHIRTIDDSEDRKIQVITLSDCFGEFVGRSDNPIYVIDNELLVTNSLLDNILSFLDTGQSTSIRDNFDRPIIYSNQGELRVSQARTLADLINKYEIDPNEYGMLTSGGGSITHLPNHQAIQLSVTSATGSSALLRTHTYYRYQAGKTVRSTITIYHSDNGQANQIRRWGIFDNDDGLFFQLNGTTLEVVRRSSTSGSVIEVSVEKSNWNIDPMDGTGPSGMSLDLLDGNIYQIMYQWLGVGITTFLIDGWPVHRIDSFNVAPAPWARTGQLPLSWEVENTDSSSSGSMTFICANLSLEGGEEPSAISFSAGNETQQMLSLTERPIFSIRPSFTYNGITSRMLIIPKILTLIGVGGRVQYRLVLNSSLTGASWTSVSPFSGVEVDTSSTAGTGGITLFKGFLANNISESGTIDLSEFFSTVSSGRQMRVNAFASGRDVLSVYATHDSVANTSLARCSISWNEVR